MRVILFLRDLSIPLTYFVPAPNRPGPNRLVHSCLGPNRRYTVVAYQYILGLLEDLQNSLATQKQRHEKFCWRFHLPSHIRSLGVKTTSTTEKSQFKNWRLPYIDLLYYAMPCHRGLTYSLP